MHPSRLRLRCPHLVLLLSLMLLAGLAGCGPASSDHAPTLGPNASADGLSLSKQGPSSHNDSFTPAASPVPLASVQGTGAQSGMGPLPEGNSRPVASAPSPNPVESLDARGVPEWMAKELASPDVYARLRALETWAESAPPGAVGPLLLAIKDKDERVQARAIELLEQDSERDSEEEK
ncbi:MAG: hypothetical protein ACRDGM_20790 [bacterium]